MKTPMTIIATALYVLAGVSAYQSAQLWMARDNDPQDRFGRVGCGLMVGALWPLFIVTMGGAYVIFDVTPPGMVRK